MSTQLGGGVDIIVPTRSSPLPDTSPEPAAALASSKSEKLTTNIFPDIELHVTRLILIPLSLNKIESEELVVDDVEKSFDNNEVSYENLGETIAVTNLGELFNSNVNSFGACSLEAVCRLGHARHCRRAQDFILGSCFVFLVTIWSAAFLMVLLVVQA